MDIRSTDTRVQSYSTKKIFFTIEHDLTGKAGVKIRFPYELDLKDDAPLVEIVDENTGKRDV